MTTTDPKVIAKRPWLAAAVSARAATSLTVHRTAPNGTQTTFHYQEGWHIVADLHTRLREVRVKGDDHDAKMRLQRHCALISLSAVLTVITTFAAVTFLHWDCVIPIVPSYLQEFHDWLYKL
jgi:hypothetical protein